MLGEARLPSAGATTVRPPPQPTSATKSATNGRSPDPLVAEIRHLRFIPYSELVAVVGCSRLTTLSNSQAFCCLSIMNAWHFGFEAHLDMHCFCANFGF